MRKIDLARPWAVALLSLVGCAPMTPPKGVAPATHLKGETPQHVGTLDGVLITEDIPTATQITDKTVPSEKMVIVQCPSCNQRVDVTGLPREGIRCPNCNSLFTY